MMQEIGNEMQEATGALSQKSRTSEDFEILDLCMAPGGYTASALQHNPTAKAVGITLPPDQGGHQVLLDSPHSCVFYHDITMFANDPGGMGLYSTGHFPSLAKPPSGPKIQES
jgi:hypothetical protein